MPSAKLTCFCQSNAHGVIAITIEHSTDVLAKVTGGQVWDVEDVLHPVSHLGLGDGVAPRLGIVDDLVVPHPQDLVRVGDGAHQTRHLPIQVRLRELSGLTLDFRGTYVVQFIISLVVNIFHD